mmetsp:Transcript_20138/g.36534  ORF Transcript_20138/g.36534 Transcript_20138/m.36534 type:complete len:88 (-) Transcript_20138:1275-1538(-)
MGFISAHASWDCPPVVLWDSESRLADIDEISYHATLVKKSYLGHMLFIGELYKGDLISIKIMLHVHSLLAGHLPNTWLERKVHSATE